MIHENFLGTAQVWESNPHQPSLSTRFSNKCGFTPNDDVQDFDVFWDPPFDICQVKWSQICILVNDVKLAYLGGRRSQDFLHEVLFKDIGRFWVQDQKTSPMAIPTIKNDIVAFGLLTFQNGTAMQRDFSRELLVEPNTQIPETLRHCCSKTSTHQPIQPRTKLWQKCFALHPRQFHWPSFCS